MKVIDLKSCQEVGQVVQALRNASKSVEGSLFLVADSEVFMVVPAEVMKSQIAAQIANRFAQQPSLLHDLQDRLANEVPQDWELEADDV